MKINENGADKLEFSYNNKDGIKTIIFVDNEVLTQNPGKNASVEKQMQWALSLPFQTQKPKIVGPTISQKFDSVYNFLDLSKNTRESLKLSDNPGKKIWWKHSNCGHSYQLSISNRFKYEPKCTLCFYLNKPDYGFISKFWDETKNGKLTYMPPLSEKVHWKCPDCHSEAYMAISRFYNHPNCKNCLKIERDKQRERKKEYLKEKSKFHGSSLKERELFYFLTIVFGDQVKNRYKFNKVEVDVFIPEYKIAVEYDGFYYHKGCEYKDKQKNDKLAAFGINIIRIRENGLDQITNNDISYNYGSSMSVLMNNLLNKIKSIYELKLEHVDKIDEFLKQDINAIQLPQELINPVLFEESFKYNYPDISKNFHPDFNTEFDLSKISKRSQVINKNMWWKCPKCNFEWREPAVNLIKRDYTCHRCKLNQYKNIQ